jgi:ABC-type enterochelin transport system substrate-binding protein
MGQKAKESLPEKSYQELKKIKPTIKLVTDEKKF